MYNHLFPEGGTEHTSTAPASIGWQAFLSTIRKIVFNILKHSSNKKEKQRIKLCWSTFTKSVVSSNLNHKIRIWKGWLRELNMKVRAIKKKYS